MRSGLFLSLCGAVTASTSVPLFMWSGQSYFSDVSRTNAHVQVPEMLTANEFTGVFESMVQPSQQRQQASTLRKYFHPMQSAPEVVVAFVYSKMGSTSASRALGAYSSTEAVRDSVGGTALSHLQATLAQSRSSLIAPYVAASGTFTKDLVSHVQKASANARVVNIRLNQEGGCADLKAQLGQDSTVFSNGVVDLVLVQGNERGVSDSCMAAINSEMNQQTNGNFVGLMSADNADHFVQEAIYRSAGANAGVNSRRLLADSTAIVWVGPQFITSPIFLGLLLGFFLIGMLCCGICAMLAIETPVRYGTKKLLIARET